MSGRQYAAALQLKLGEAGLSGALQADAFRTLLRYAEEIGGDLDVLYAVLDDVKRNLDCSGSVSAAAVEAATAAQRAGRNGAAVGSGPERVAVIDAFSVPRVRFDGLHKRLVQDTAWTPGLQPTAEAKVRMHQDRYSMLYQRLRRNSLFAPQTAVQASLPGQRHHAQLCELTGLKGTAGRRVITMGLIISQDDGSLALEDEGGVLPVDLSAAQLQHGLVAEGCVVVAEGSVGMDGVLKVSALGFPGCERREELPPTAQRLNFFGGATLSSSDRVALELAEAEAEHDRVVFLADVWLDRPATFEALHTLFSGFTDAGMVPSLMVFMGNFSAAAGSGGGPSAAAAATAAVAGSAGGGCVDYLALREGFSTLARLMDTYPAIKEGCQCVFVPGPADPGLGALLPQSPLPSYFTAELAAVLPNAVFATNPCRIRYYTREIVVFRHDITKAMRRRCLLPPPARAAEDPGELFRQLALTLLQQSCLCPLPLPAAPVHWAHAHALALYPLPHALVLADASAPPGMLEHEGCRTFNPGCLPERCFAAYLPIQDELEPSALPGVAPDDVEDGEQLEQQQQGGSDD